MNSKDWKFKMGASGVWQVEDADESILIDTIETDSDRAAAIIAATIVERRLMQLFELRTVYDEKVNARLFMPSGPLGSFSTKIDLCRLMGWISSDAHRELVCLKDIRNAFAHHLQIKDFKSQKIADKCQNLKLIDSYMRTSENVEGSPIVTITSPRPKPCMWVHDFDNRKSNPKSRYLYTVQLFLFALATIDTSISPLL